MSRDIAVVFEPHNDDFVIGMGGTGLHLLDSGWDVVSVVLTDGRFGSSDLEPEQTATVRAEEKDRETELLGTDWINLGFADQSLSRRSEEGDEREEILTKFSNVLKRTDPSIVFVPSPTEGHPDHRATHDLVTSALDREQFDVPLVEYIVWDVPFFSPIASSPNQIVKVGIDAVFEEKVSAIRMHESQLREYPFSEMVANFNGYLSNLYHPESSDEYVELLHVRERTASVPNVLDTIGAEDVTGKFHTPEQ